MVIYNSNTGYMQRKNCSQRSWWMIKSRQVRIGHMHFPDSYIGRKFRIKIEFIKEKEIKKVSFFKKVIKRLQE